MVGHGISGAGIMRVVGGEAKGFPLKAPKTGETRPTSDKVREAIFNVVGQEVVDAEVLDLYAGSGALAIEALSRGAAHAVLVESHREACSVIRANLEKTGFATKATVWTLPVLRALPRLSSQFNLILADPPYAAAEIDEVMAVLGDGSIIAEEGNVVLEHGKRFDSRATYGKLRRWQMKRYGDTAVSFYVIDGGHV
jgi:16S rRNA (guanine966-N2)-methyltransferase